MSLKLFPYQEQAAEWMQKHSRRLLCLEQGLGKTPVAIETAVRLGVRTARVTCPAIARVMWERRFAQWAPRIDVEVHSYDAYSRGSAPISEVDVHILDEGHYLKNPESKRTAAIYGPDCDGSGAVRLARRVWVLSGTLTPNHPVEVFPHIRALFPALITRAGRVPTAHKFLDTHFEWRRDFATQRIIPGKPKPGLIGELRSIVRAITYRRLQRDVLPDLPPLRVDAVELSVAQVPKELKDQGAAERVVKGIRDGAPPADLASSALRRVTGQVKAEAAVEYVTNALVGNAQKAVVFFYHTAVGAVLVAGLKAFGAVLVDGSVTGAARQRAVDDFQGGTTRVFVGQLTVCATAIDLYAATRAVFVESDWVPATMEQAIKRLHRIGQTQPVQVDVLSVAGSFDEFIARALVRKTRDIMQLEQTGEG